MKGKIRNPTKNIKSTDKQKKSKINQLSRRNKISQPTTKSKIMPQNIITTMVEY
jgi:hypothetical protein